MSAPVAADTMSVVDRPKESVLVVVERHAACPLWMNHWGDAPLDGWSMLEHEEWEPDESFVDRLHAVLDGGSDEATGATVILVAGAVDDATTVAARFEMAIALLSYLSHARDARLVLTRGYGANHDSDSELASFAAELADEWEAPAVDISIRAPGASRAAAAAQIRAA